MRLVDLAEMLGVSRKRAHQLVQREHFPKPVGTYGGGRYGLWAAKDVRAWADSYRGGVKRWRRRRSGAVTAFGIDVVEERE